VPNLHSLRPDYHLLSHKEKVLFIRAYRKRRASDLAKPATYGAKATTSQTMQTKLQAMGLTPEEIALAKSLGLKPKDILKLREPKNDL